MLYLITGVPGSGKSLLAVSWVKKWLAEGRPVYTDIDGLNLPVSGCSPRDWRETPEGSVVVYDEAQGKFPSTGRPGRPDDDVIQAMEVHRHTGHDLVFITQAGTMVHHHIRKLIGRHYHVQRIMGGKAAALFSWYEATDERDRQARRRADRETWRFPVDLFAAYKSATVHTHKFKIPRRLLVSAGIIVALISAVLAAASQAEFFWSGGESLETAIETSGAPSGPRTVQPAVSSAPAISSWVIDGLVGRLGGVVEVGLNNARLSRRYRLAGWVTFGDQTIYLISDENRSYRVPGELFKFIEYEHGVLTVRGPGGPMRITAVSGPQPQIEMQSEPAIVRQIGSQPAMAREPQ